MLHLFLLAFIGPFVTIIIRILIHGSLDSRNENKSLEPFLMTKKKQRKIQLRAFPFSQPMILLIFKGKKVIPFSTNWLWIVLGEVDRRSIDERRLDMT